LKYQDSKKKNILFIQFHVVQKRSTVVRALDQLTKHCLQYLFQKTSN